MELSSCNIKKFLTFSQEKAVHIFHETETPKNKTTSINKLTRILLVVFDR